MMSASSTRILVVDDEPLDRDTTTAFLEDRGFKVKSPRSVEEIHELLAACKFDLVLLDLLMRKWELDTRALLHRLTEEIGLPVIMISGESTPNDRNRFLDEGADDFLVKPVSPQDEGTDNFVVKPVPPLQWGDTELLARIGAVLRRANGRDGTDGRAGAVYSFEGWSLDPARRELRDPGGVLVGLTDGEFRLLLALLREPGKELAREQLLGPGDASDRSVDVHVSRLRNKLEPNPETPEFIKTVRGVGYVLAVPVKPP